MDIKEEIYNAINKILSSDLSTAEIARRTGVNKSNISRLRTKDAKIENLKLSTVLTLYKFSKNI